MVGWIIISFLFLFLLAIFLFYSFVARRYIYILEKPEEVPSINNQKNILWIKKQPSSSSFSFLVVGDIQSSFQGLKRYLLKEGHANYSFIIQTGDLISHSDEGHYALRLYQLKQCNLKVPFFVVPGNHDIKGKHPKLFQKFFVLRQFYFFWNNILFIIIDTSSSPPYDEKFFWLKRVLEENQKRAKRTFIFMHRGPLEGDEGKINRSKDDFKLFLEIIEKYHIDYVFCGHTHGYLKRELKGVNFITNGVKARIGRFRIIPSYLTQVEVSSEEIKTHQISIRPNVLELFYDRMIDNIIAHIYPFINTFLNRLGMMIS